MGNNCCTADGGAKVTTLEADAPKAEEDAAGNEAEAVADAFSGAAASHDEAYAAEQQAPVAEAAAAGKPAAPTGPSAAPAPSSQEPAVIVFELQRTLQDSIGLNLDAVDDSAPFVDDILDGSIKDWNQSHSEEKQLKIYDRIVEVNGVKGNTNNILAAMKQTGAWNLVLQRPCQMTVTVTTDQSISLGLDLKYSPNGRSLLIDEILADGGIRRWNEEHQDRPVKAFDRVIQINGKMGSAKELLESAANKTSLELVVLRYTS